MSLTSHSLSSSVFITAQRAFRNFPRTVCFGGIFVEHVGLLRLGLVVFFRINFDQLLFDRQLNLMKIQDVILEPSVPDSPVLDSTLKLSKTGPGQNLDDRPLGNSWCRWKGSDIEAARKLVHSVKSEGSSWIVPVSIQVRTSPNSTSIKISGDK